MKTFACFLVMILTSTLTWADAAPQAVSYKEYLSQVLAYYPSLKRESASLEKAIAQKALTAAGRLPRFWASLSSDYGNDPVYVFGALLRQNRFTSGDFALDRLNTPKSQSDNAAEIGGEWMLFDFFKTVNRIKAAGLLEESALYQRDFIQMEAILAASEIYGRLASTDGLLRVLTEEAQKSGDDISALESLNKKGLALGADFYLARITHAHLLELRNEVASQREALNLVFNVIRGFDPLTPVAVSMDLSKSALASGSVEDYIGKASANRLDIRSITKMLEAGSWNAAAEKKNLAPKITAYGSASEHSKAFASSGGENYMIGVKAKVDLDFADASRLKLAKAEVERLSAQLREAKDQAAKDAAETFFRLKSMEANILLAKQSSSDADQALKLMTPLYKEGRRSIADMLSTRMAKVSAFERWLKLESSRRLMALSLQLYTGDLTPALAEGVYGQ